jgi:hypothetical protein
MVSGVPGDWSGNSYVANYGSGIVFGGGSSVADGPFWFNNALNPVGARFADLIDGSTYSAMFSERLVGDWTNAIATERSDLFNPKGVMPANADEACMMCRAINPLNLADQWRSDFGGYWLQGWHMTLYTHASPPNDRACAYPQNRTMTMPATSAHPLGVNVLNGDGSLRFVTTRVDITAWRSFGTRKGGEALGDDF